MAWTVANIQNQVELMTDHSGLDQYVLDWTNRVIMEIGGKALWPQQLVTFALGAFSQATTPVGQLKTIVEELDIIQPYNVTYPDGDELLIRRENSDFWPLHEGGAINFSTGDFRYYAVPKFIEYNNGGEYHQLPQMVVYPITNETTDQLTVRALRAPAKFTSSSGSNWMTDRFFQTVLAGVMRWASLAIGDPNAYLGWKAKFMNGVKDMVLDQKTTLAATPRRRGVTPEEVYRGAQ